MGKFKKSTANSQSGSRMYKSSDLVAQMQEAARSTARIRASADVQQLSTGASIAPTGIQFGIPSSAGTKSNTSSGNGNEWTNLLKSAASKGPVEFLSGGFLQAGIDSLISGVTSLFHGEGKATPTPLVRFALPESQQESRYITSEGTLSSFGNATASHYGSSTGSYTNLQSPGSLHRQSEIVQAVRNALLTSSSLNDVIAEI